MKSIAFTLLAALALAPLAAHAAPADMFGMRSGNGSNNKAEMQQARTQLQAVRTECRTAMKAAKNPVERQAAMESCRNKTDAITDKMDATGERRMGAAENHKMEQMRAKFEARRAAAAAKNGQ